MKSYLKLKAEIQTQAIKLIEMSYQTVTIDEFNAQFDLVQALKTELDIIRFEHVKCG